jgi:histidinol-phosphate aminotransferase
MVTKYLMRPDWTTFKYSGYQYNLSNNICIDTLLPLPNSDLCCLNSYPDEYPIYEALEKHHNIPMENIAIGYGLGELIQRIYLHCNVGSINVVTPSWPMSEIFLDIYKIPYNQNPTSDTIYISNPNGVNGHLYDKTYIKNLLNLHKLVIVDEAYMDFANESMIPELLNYDNLLILKTLSKSLPCPGLRLGYCLGNNDIIKQLQLTRPSCVAHGLTVELVPKLLQYIPEHVYRMLETKQIIIEKYDGIDCYGNFVLFDHMPKLQKNVLIKSNTLHRMSLFNKELLSNIFR